MKNILITGGTGAIGSGLVKKLIEQDDFDNLVILDNNSSGHADNVKEHPKVTLVEGDICDDAVLDEAFSHKITHVYHLAANFANQSSVDYPVKDLMTNGIGTVKVLEHCVKNKVTKVLYSSSSCVYKPTQDPFAETSPLMITTPYSITKLLGEHYSTFFNKFHQLPIVVVRYFSNYGPGDYPGKFRSVIPNFIHAARNGESLTITGTGEETRPFTFIDDVVDGTIAAMEKSPEKHVENYYTHPLDPEDNIIYNIGTETVTTMQELAETINALTGNKAEIKYVPRRDWDMILHRAVDGTKAKKELGFEAKVGLEEGLKKTIQWFDSEDFNADHIKA